MDYCHADGSQTSNWSLQFTCGDLAFCAGCLRAHAPHTVTSPPPLASGRIAPACPIPIPPPRPLPTPSSRASPLPRPLPTLPLRRVPSPHPGLSPAPPAGWRHAAPLCEVRTWSCRDRGTRKADGLRPRMLLLAERAEVRQQGKPATTSRRSACNAGKKRACGRDPPGGCYDRSLAKRRRPFPIIHARCCLGGISVSTNSNFCFFS
jgi:hypothetical protein